VDTKYINDLLAQRANVVSQQRGELDRIAETGMLPSAEENEKLARMDADYEGLSSHIGQWMKTQEREQDAGKAREILDSIVSPEDKVDHKRKQNAAEDWFRGHIQGTEGRKHFDVDLKPSANFLRQVRSGMDAAEARTMYTDGGASGGSLVVPVQFLNQLYQFIEESSSIRQISRVLTSNEGGAWTLPRVQSHGIGTQVAGQGTTLAGTPPVFGTLRLDDFRYAQLVKVSNTMAVDTGFDLLGFIAENIGRAVGRVTDTAYATGSGSGQPNGVLTAASTGATTGGSLIALGGGAATGFTNSVNPLINLQHSVAEEYANNGVFVMNRQTAGTLRGLRADAGGTTGAYIWTPTTTFDGVRTLGAAGEILGSPVYSDVNFGTQGSAVRTVAFGDFSAYYIRDVGNFRFERSDERYFDTDELGFRGIIRTDSDLIDTEAIKVLRQTP